MDGCKGKLHVKCKQWPATSSAFPAKAQSEWRSAPADHSRHCKVSAMEHFSFSTELQVSQLADVFRPNWPKSHSLSTLLLTFLARRSGEHWHEANDTPALTVIILLRRSMLSILSLQDQSIAFCGPFSPASNFSTGPAICTWSVLFCVGPGRKENQH